MENNTRADRIDVQETFEKIVGKGRVYFQPGDMSRLSLPYLVYDRIAPDVKRGNNAIYLIKQRYSGTYITTDPDDKIIEQLELLPHLTVIRVNKVDGAYNYYFNYY